ncbi:MAG: hypothetical protein IJU65_02480 [Desulfovibrio sp.]|nr:hypothetical protein [Desulfovibrio sp.]
MIGIVDNAGNLVIEYRHDAWGKPIGTTANSTLTTQLAELNPFRYRGYVWDQETALYYACKRYYNPIYCRWLNYDKDEVLFSDNHESLIQYNLIAYCFNNPVNYFDENGKWPKWLKKAVAVVAVAVVVVAATAITVATCGAGSVAGVAMITATATIAARTTEVAVLQVKKVNRKGKTTTK